MKKQFNITGVCIPEDHYMVDISQKTAKILEMIAHGDYFVINRPRQYGKTTTLFMLNQLLKHSGEYFPIEISFEGMDEDRFRNANAFINEFILILKEEFSASGNQEMVKFIESGPIPDSLNGLGLWLSELIVRIGKKIILMIDEIDKSSNNQLFLDFLGMLRNKYLKRKTKGHVTFHSVILAGVHDVKSLKLKLRPEDEAKYNSPWNIAVDFNVDLSFSAQEIGTMLSQYASERHVMLDIPFFSDRLFYYTSGYPFLVSYLCKMIDEKILPRKNANEWRPEDLEQAVHLTLKQNNTNFENLIKNLANHPELYDLVFKLVMNEMEFSFNIYNSVIALGVLHGILREESGKTRIHNRVYEQLIYNYMTSNLETSGSIDLSQYDTGSSYLGEGGGLNMEKVIRKFQQFMAEQYTVKDMGFIERNGRLLFLAFIKPIINGRGFDFKEVQVSEEKRLDVVITFDNRKYIIELKLWRGESYHREGIRQLSDYLDCQHERNGYLLIYDLRKESGQTGKVETIELGNKKILAAWV
ncbi:MAG: AAA family ATPase [Candidatus Omnitrophota bacterium]